MNPEQGQSSQPSNSSQPQAPIQTSSKKPHKTLALILLIGPTVILILTFLLYAISNLIANSAQPAPNSEDLFSEQNPATAILNTLAFLLGAIGFLTWLPGIIVGIILLNKKSHV